MNNTNEKHPPIVGISKTVKVNVEDVTAHTILFYVGEGTAFRRSRYFLSSAKLMMKRRRMTVAR